jgi:Glycosyltransferase like family 2
MMPAVTICVLTYGDHPRLAQRALESILGHCPRWQYRLIVGANAVSAETEAYLKSLQAKGEIDQLIVSPVNLNKCPMMRRMFDRVETEFIWWFDDDSYILGPHPLPQWFGRAQADAESTVMWGQLAWCDHPLAFTPDPDGVLGFVRSAPWYRGLPPPSWRPGGKGEFDFQNRGCGDGRWVFILGGCWLVRTRAVRVLDWPDRRLSQLGDDVLLGEAIRQQGWHLADIGTPGVAIDTEPHRGHRVRSAARDYSGSGPIGTLTLPKI